MATPLLERLLGPHLPGHEPRASQQQMADAVASTLMHSGKLIVEAGTGVGKSLAYLIPLCEHVLNSGDKRAVVSTYTKALQRQLVEKDLPFIKEHIFPELRFTLCLGSDNYLCLRRMELSSAHGLFTERDDDVERLMRWADTTAVGVRESTPAELWAKVAREYDMCHGRDCRHFMRCFYQRAKERERKSHVLVINHHLYFADLATGKRVLPPAEYAVFDEAHELEDVAADYMGPSVSNYGVRNLLNSLISARGRGLLTRLKWLAERDFSYLSSLVALTRGHSEQFFKSISERMTKSTIRIRTPDFVEDTLSESLLRLYREMESVHDQCRTEEERRDVAAMAKRCEATAISLEDILTHSLKDHVYWASSGERFVRIAATPVDIAHMGIFDGLDAAIYTSATLSTGGDFHYIKDRLGIDDAMELALPSHFDYKRQAVLYIGADLPEPTKPHYPESVIQRVQDILEITGGRTLVLFTSHALLKRAVLEVHAPGVTILRQGDGDSYSILERFKQDPQAAIFGTSTFWQGVDLPGDVLRCVVITRLPFAAPDDPVAQARMELLERQGKDAFSDYQVPRAAIMLKQGFGRLIRRKTDTGVVAILDSRIKTKGYGKAFLRSLPECAITDDLGALARAFHSNIGGHDGT